MRPWPSIFTLCPTLLLPPPPPPIPQPKNKQTLLPSLSSIFVFVPHHHCLPLSWKMWVMCTQTDTGAHTFITHSCTHTHTCRQAHTHTHTHTHTSQKFQCIKTCFDACLQTVPECIQYYYLMKKSENYKQLLRKQNMKRNKKALQKSQVCPCSLFCSLRLLLIVWLKEWWLVFVLF